MQFKPTAMEWAIIKEVAFRGHETADVPIKTVYGVQLECRTSYNMTDRDKPTSINMALVTNDWPECNDCDLDDRHTGLTERFRKGADLTDDGRGLFDFYIYNRYHRDAGELCGNVLVRVENGKMEKVWIEGGRDIVWTMARGVHVGVQTSRAA